MEKENPEDPNNCLPRSEKTSESGTPDGTSLNRRRFLSGIAGLGASAFVFGDSAIAQSTAWQQPGNNNDILDLQYTEKPSERRGSVRIDYMGHCAFRLTSPEGNTVLVDPWRDDPSGAWGKWYKQEFPEIVVDITLSTHSHFDHDAIYRPHSTMVLDRMVGTLDFSDIRIIGVADKHACGSPGWYNWTNAIKEFGQEPCPPDNPGHMDNVAILLEMGGLRVLFWGDNRHNPPDAFWEALGRVDVLTIPVDGSEHILSDEQVNGVVERLKPGIIIPTHYLNESTTYTLSTLQPADKWVTQQANHRTLDSPELELHPDEVRDMDREVFYFGHEAKLS